MPKRSRKSNEPRVGRRARRSQKSKEKGDESPRPRPAAPNPRVEDDALIRRLIEASPLESEDAKRGLATDFVVASRAVAAIRKKLDAELALGDEVRALPALISNRRRLLESLKLIKEKPKADPFSLDDDDEEDEQSAPKPGEVPPDGDRYAIDGDELLQEIKG